MGFDWLTIAVFGWPAVLLSLCLTITAFVKVRWRLLLVAAFVSLPFGLYFSASPSFRIIGPLAILAFFVSPLALRKRRILTAIILAMPFFAVAGWLLFQVVSQNGWV